MQRTDGAVKELMKQQEALRAASAASSSDAERQQILATIESIIGSFKAGHKKDLQAVVK